MPEPQRRDLLAYFETRFGIPLTTFDPYRLLERRKVYVLVPDTPHLEALATLKVQSVGLPVLRKMGRHLKPTTAVLQRVGHLATRHIVDLSPQQATALLRGETLPNPVAAQPGYVILKQAGHILGCGVSSPAGLRSLIPRRHSAHQRL